MQSHAVPPTLPTWIQSISSESRVYGAGCMFVNETHALIGIHTPRCESGTVRMCGFGGKAEGEEQWWQTAFRETLEELFNVSNISNTVYDALLEIEPIKILQQEKPRYITLVYSFGQLNRFLYICHKYQINTTLYTTFPTCANDLVFGREEVPHDAEISHIVYWPLKNAYKRFRITTDFAEDMRLVIESA